MGKTCKWSNLSIDLSGPTNYLGFEQCVNRFQQNCPGLWEGEAKYLANTAAAPFSPHASEDPEMNPEFLLNVQLVRA